MEKKGYEEKTPEDIRKSDQEKIDSKDLEIRQ